MGSNGSARTGSSTPAPKKMGSKKIGTDLVVLSSVAILSVYGIGYQRTLAGANAIASLDSSNIAQASADLATPSPVATPVVLAAAPTPQIRIPSPTSVSSDASSPTVRAAVATASPIPIARANPTATAIAKLVLPTATVVKAGQYRDGTFVGQGFSRHGGIEATVVIAGGKIVSANISQCSTRYPCSDVAPLIPEVVARQAAPIHYISGASDSSQAYHDAVIKALSQAA